jgi:hypothetical protein
MKTRSFYGSIAIFSLAVLAACSRTNTGASTAIPHLQKQGTATQLIVDGKPFLVLAGELRGNSASNLPYWKRVVWPRVVAQAKLNTILAAVSWAQVEPQEGKFEFSVLDSVIRDARSHNLRLVLLWFATWKNGLSSYPPDWVKRDFERFPRAQIAGGKSIELLSPLGDATRDADARAFAALMRHIKAVDGREHTVIMIQVENEIGMQRDSRDRSPLANAAYEAPVPKELMDYLQNHKDSLVPEFRQVWEATGFKTSGTWEDVFGRSPATDEIFMGWNFARHVGRVAEAGKAEYPLPMFVNAYVVGFPKTNQRGNPQSGSPMPDLLDVWRAAAPRIDILGVDAYGEFAEPYAKYNRSGNPLFIPESRGGPEGAARVLYAFGRHDAIGFSSSGIDGPMTPDNDLMSSYDLIAQLAPLIAEHQGKGTMSAVLLRGPTDPPQKIQVGNYTLEVAFLGPRAIPWEPPPPQNQPPSAAIFIAAGPDEYYVAGNGVRVTFSPDTPGPPFAGLATIEEGTFVDGRWVAGRRLAGDDAGQGDYLDLRNQRLDGDPDRGIQRVTLYRYR